MDAFLSSPGREGFHFQARGTRKLSDFPVEAGISEMA